MVVPADLSPTEFGAGGTPTESCVSCGAPLVCTPGPDCWCAALPFRPMPAAPPGCLCPTCLAATEPAPAAEG